LKKLDKLLVNPPLRKEARIKEIKPLVDWDFEKIGQTLSKSTFTKGGKNQRDKTFSELGL
jgi:hypothetical protein